MEKEVEIMFDGVLKPCKLEDDRNGEYLFVADDGRFVKFPVGGDLDDMIAAHNKANESEVEIIPDVEYGEVITFDAEGNEVK